MSARHSTARRLRLSAGSLIVGLASVAVVVLPAQVASANTDIVTNCGGAASTSGSLPYEVANAASGDTITFQSGLSCPPASPITLTSNIDITQSLTITGPGANTMVVSGDNAHTWAVEITTVGTVNISGLTIENGYNLQGAGIGNFGSESTLNLTNAIVSDNNTCVGCGGGGGGIFNVGTLTVTNSTLSGNTGEVRAGGIFNETGGTATIKNSTLSGNSAGNTSTDYGGNGGAIDNFGTMTIINSTLSGNSTDPAAGDSLGEAIINNGNLTIISSTLTGNTGAGGGIYDDPQSYTPPVGYPLFVGASILADNTGGNCSGYEGQVITIDEGYNIADDDSCKFTATGSVNSSTTLDASLAGGLQNYGGPTDTILPTLSSPAVGVIPNPTTLDGVQVCSRTDQRGFAGPQPGETKCTIGAVEVGTVVPNLTSIKPGKGTQGTKVTINGTNLAGATGVKFNGVTAVITTDTANKITTKVPAGATTGFVTVTTTGGMATSAKKFKVT